MGIACFYIVFHLFSLAVRLTKLSDYFIYIFLVQEFFIDFNEVCDIGLVES